MVQYISPVLSEVPATKAMVADQVAWYVVAISILICLAIIMATACFLFCLAKGKSLAGYYKKDSGSFKVGCE